MPSAWSWSSIPELLSYGSSLISGANAYCGVHHATAALTVLPWLDGFHLWVLCGA
jgi:hypothetical protein